jgi:uroporphyrinogen-III synthase
VIELPLLRFEPIAHEALPDVEDFDWILFTSPQGVRAFASAGLAPAEVLVGSLGAGTRAALHELGWTDALDVECRDGRELAERFAAQMAAPARVLLPGPERRMGDPRQSLEAIGFAVTELPLYRTLPIPPGDLPKEPLQDGDVVFFCSPSAVSAFAAARNDRPFCVAIGETTAAAARDAGFVSKTAVTPDLNAMVRAAGLDPLPDPVLKSQDMEMES